MRKSALTTIILAGSATAILSINSINPAHAQPPRDRGAAGVGTPPVPGQRLNALRERFDTNNDGKVDESERTAARESIKKNALERFDTDKSGKIDDDERPHILEKMNGPIARGIKHRIKQRFDANRDGALDEKERAAAKEQVRGRLIERFDRNGDGKIDDAERATARRHIHGRIAERMRHRAGHFGNGGRAGERFRSGPQSFHGQGRPHHIAPAPLRGSQGDFGGAPRPGMDQHFAPRPPHDRNAPPRFMPPQPQPQPQGRHNEDARFMPSHPPAQMQGQPRPRFEPVNPQRGEPQRRPHHAPGPDGTRMMPPSASGEPRPDFRSRQRPRLD